MNYRHAYHAGNFADVLKHAVLALVIEHLKQKPAPFRVIDTHAGIGVYDLGVGGGDEDGRMARRHRPRRSTPSCRQMPPRRSRPISAWCAALNGERRADALSGKPAASPAV